MTPTNRTMDDLASALYGGPAPSEHVGAGNMPRTEDELGEALFGPNGTMCAQQAAITPTDTAQPASEPPRQRSQEELAEAMFPKETPLQLAQVPPEVQALRDDPARRLYSAQTSLKAAIPDATAAEEGFTLQQTNQAVAELREIAADLDLGAQDVATLKQRAGQLRTNPTEAAAQQEATVQALNARFGEQATQALRDARLLLKRDPRAARMIESLGLGNDPATVMLIAERARNQIMAGRLKR